MPLGSSFRFDWKKDGPNLNDENVNSLDSGLNVYRVPAALEFNVTAGRFTSGAAFVDYAGTLGNPVPASTIGTAVWLDGAGVLQTGAAFPGTPHLPLAEVDTDAIEIIAIRDKRPRGGAVGALAAPPLELAGSGAVGEATYVKYDGPVGQQIDLSSLAGRLGQPLVIRNASIFGVNIKAAGAEQISTVGASGNLINLPSGVVLRLVALATEWSEA